MCVCLACCSPSRLPRYGCSHQTWGGHAKRAGGAACTCLPARICRPLRPPPNSSPPSYTASHASTRTRSPAHSIHRRRRRGRAGLGPAECERRGSPPLSRGLGGRGGKWAYAGARARARGDTVGPSKPCGGSAGRWTPEQGEAERVWRVWPRVWWCGMVMWCVVQSA